MQQTGLTKLAVLTALSLLAAALIYPTTFSFFRKPFAARQARVTSRSQLRNMSIQAIHVNKSGHPSGLELTEIPIPTISSPHDILVKIKGVALNPVDTKVRGGAATGRILGYDASGIVEAAGDQAIFKKGDSVIYAGAIGRPGSNQQYQLVDSRIAAKKPESLAWDDAAALPLVSITAWEMFEDKFRLKPFTDNSKEILLIVNGAGGVGSIAIELAKKVFGIKTIIATASRPETIEWVKKLGATHVINHREELGAQLKALNIEPSLSFITYDTTRYVKELIPITRPFGQIGSIVETDDGVPVHQGGAMGRSLSYHWEFMFTKPIFGHELESQGRILEQVAKLAAEGTIPSQVTVRKEFSLASLREGHELQGSGKAYGKIAFTVPETWS